MAEASASFSDLGGGGSCGGLCMTEFEFLENCLRKHEGQSLVSKFFKGKGKATNAACEMTEEVSEVFSTVGKLQIFLSVRFYAK